MIDNFPGRLAHWGRERPTSPAVAVGEHKLYDYQTLAGRVSRLASGLLSLGCKPGDRVAMILNNGPAYFDILFACWHAGLIPVPINARLHANEFAYILQNSGASLCFYSEILRSAMPASLGEENRVAISVESAAYRNLFLTPMSAVSVQGDSVAWLFYTSGTTGVPKGAMITHANLWAMCDCYFADVDDISPWSCILHPAPLSHGSGLYALAHLRAGSCQVLPQSASFETAEIFELIKAWPDAVFFAAPTMIRRLVQYPHEVDTHLLKSIIYGGAPMYLQDTKAFIERFGPKLAQLYGQGETPMTITALSQRTFRESSHPRWESRIASAGTAQSAVTVTTVDETGQPVGTGEIGEIVVSGATVMKGYWNNPAATRSAMRGRWLRTGDLGVFDDDGYLTLKDRAKDLIISGGSNIYPREVEEVLVKHPDVSEVSVIGTPDPEWGELVVAYIVVNNAQHDSSVSDLFSALDKLCLLHIARFKRPRRYRVTESLPKNNYGKVLKRSLRDTESNYDGSN